MTAIESMNSCPKCRGKMICGLSGRVVCSVCGPSDQVPESAQGAWYSGYDMLGIPAKTPPMLPKPPDERSGRRRAVLSAALDAAAAYDMGKAPAEDYIAALDKKIAEVQCQIAANLDDSYYGISPETYKLWADAEAPEQEILKCAVCGCAIPGGSDNAGMLLPPDDNREDAPEDIELCPTDYQRVLTYTRSLRRLPEGQTSKREHPRDLVSDWDLLPDAD